VERRHRRHSHPGAPRRHGCLMGLAGARAARWSHRPCRRFLRRPAGNRRGRAAAATERFSMFTPIGPPGGATLRSGDSPFQTATSLSWPGCGSAQPPAIDLLAITDHDVPFVMSEARPARAGVPALQPPPPARGREWGGGHGGGHVPHRCLCRGRRPRPRPLPGPRPLSRPPTASCAPTGSSTGTPTTQSSFPIPPRARTTSSTFWPTRLQARDGWAARRSTVCSPKG